MKIDVPNNLTEMQDLVGTISTASEQGMNFIDRFLDLSKWQEGKFELNLTSFKLMNFRYD